MQAIIRKTGGDVARRRFNVSGFPRRVNERDRDGMKNYAKTGRSEAGRGAPRKERLRLAGRIEGLYGRGSSSLVVSL
jgi:hypothetical protein